MTCGRSVVFSTNKTDRHDINKILLKVALNTIKSTKPVKLSQMKGQGVLLQMLKYMYMYPEINFFLLQELKRRIGGDSGLDNSKSGGIILDTKPVGGGGSLCC